MRLTATTRQIGDRGSSLVRVIKVDVSVLVCVFQLSVDRLGNRMEIFAYAEILYGNRIWNSHMEIAYGNRIWKSLTGASFANVDSVDL